MAANRIVTWRAATWRLSLEAKGLYADLIGLWHEGLTVPNDSVDIAEELGLRNYRTVQRPLTELIARGKVRVDEGGNIVNAEGESPERATPTARAGRPAGKTTRADGLRRSLLNAVKILAPKRRQAR